MVGGRVCHHLVAWLQLNWWQLVYDTCYTLVAGQRDRRLHCGSVPYGCRQPEFHGRCSSIPLAYHVGVLCVSLARARALSLYVCVCALTRNPRLCCTRPGVCCRRTPTAGRTVGPCGSLSSTVSRWGARLGEVCKAATVGGGSLNTCPSAWIAGRVRRISRAGNCRPHQQGDDGDSIGGGGHCQCHYHSLTANNKTLNKRRRACNTTQCYTCPGQRPRSRSAFCGACSPSQRRRTSAPNSVGTEVKVVGLNVQCYRRPGDVALFFHALPCKPVRIAQFNECGGN